MIWGGTSSRKSAEDEGVKSSTGARQVAHTNIRETANTIAHGIMIEIKALQQGAAHRNYSHRLVGETMDCEMRQREAVHHDFGKHLVSETDKSLIVMRVA